MSENKKYFYLKLKDSFFSSEEMLVLESVPDGMIYQNIYLRMCLLSLKNEGALTFKNMLPYDIKMLATVLRVDIAKMKMALELFEQLGLVTKTDNEVLFMSDIQALIGQSSTEAERIARYRKRIAESNNVTETLPDKGCTEGVQMLQSCTPKIELKKEIEKKKEQEQEEACVPAYVPQPLKTNKESFQNFLNDCFLMITEHNKTAKHKIPISKAIMYFTQKEGRELLELSRQYETSEIKNALQNYLKVANSDSWKSGFSFGAFCKNISEYTAEYFDISKYIDAPKNKEDVQTITDAFAEKNKTEKWFDYAILHRHREDWIKAGKPEGNDFIKWADKVYNEDVSNGITY